MNKCFVVTNSRGSIFVGATNTEEQALLFVEEYGGSYFQVPYSLEEVCANVGALGEALTQDKFLETYDLFLQQFEEEGYEVVHG